MSIKKALARAEKRYNKLYREAMRTMRSGLYMQVIKRDHDRLISRIKGKDVIKWQCIDCYSSYYDPIQKCLCGCIRFVIIDTESY